MSQRKSLNPQNPPCNPTVEQQKIIDKLHEDMDSIGSQSRFGFFSIPSNNLLGDQYYSIPKEFNHKVVDRKVIIENRGVYTIGPKSGKGPDAYFQIMDATYEPSEQIKIEQNNQDYDKKIKKVKERKGQTFNIPFKYPGPQKYKDYYDQHPIIRTFPIDKDPVKKTKVVNGKVIGEPRGIFTQPMKKGANNTPGIYFNWIPLEPEQNNDGTQSVKENQKYRKLKRVNSAIPPQRAYQRAFFPASLKKNECFSTVQQTFGYEENYFNQLKKESEAQRKANSQKYVKILPKTAASHIRPFTPNSFSKVGRDGLFDQRIWDCPSIPEKKVIVNQRERKIEMSRNRKDPFTYNKFHNTTFSPSIVGNNLNLRSEFRSLL